VPNNDGIFRLSVIAAKCFFVIVLPFLAVGFGHEVLAVAGRLTLTSSRSVAFLSGALLFIPVWRVATRYCWRPWQFICTLEHEITHAVAGLPFLFLPRSIRVTATDGGHVKQVWIGPRFLVPLYGPGSLISGLAPYFLPLAPYVLIALDLIFFRTRSSWFGIVLGFVTAFHIITTWAETAYRQPDLREAGILFSTLFLPVANLVGLGGIFAYVTGGSSAFMRFWIDGYLLSLSAVQYFFHWMTGLHVLNH
jgi:hypothetical protein